MKEKYQVNVDSVLDCQMEDYDDNVQCETFAEAKEYALDAFETVIDRLTYLSEQIRAAEKFNDLDLGCWEPLFKNIENGIQAADDAEVTKEDIQS